MSPPWGGSDFPPLVPPGEGARTKQGPELFDEPSSKSKTGKTVAIVLVVLVVVGGLVTGGYFLFSGGDNQAGPQESSQHNPPPQTTSNAPTSTTVPPDAPLIDRVPEPPGTADENSGVVQVDELESLGVLDKKSVQILAEREPENVAWRGSVKEPDQYSPHPDKVSVLAVEMPQATDAESARDDLSTHRDDRGYVHVEKSLGRIPSEVVFHKDVRKDKVTYYGMWVSGSALVQVMVGQDPLVDEPAMSGTYQRQVHAALANFQPTV
ncbi:hypothetical protein FB471_3812 [Amycolatopsis cihanbeyliensis]|uniref:Uncharacterized protein n=2 Tax=Amycolatopsis cihanbeyliensis TaxID=1128664 RepID=A0A542DLR5_AMYCI|nr:hypothetical protein FB471_3812 [Amycolatopsis cihanbeyliensis]